MSGFFILLFLVTLIAFPILWWKKRKARLSEGKESETYKKVSLIKRIVGVVCVASFFIGGALAPTPEKKAPEPQPKQEEPAPTPQPQQTDPTIHVQLDYTVEKIADHKYKISGTTNLPDGIELMLTLDDQDRIEVENGIPAGTSGDKLTDEQFAKLNKLWYRGQDKPTVSNGKFETTFGGETLNPGEYNLTFSTPMWKLMKDSAVKEKLGEGAKNLEGKGVVDAAIGNGNGKVIRLEEKVILP